MSKVAKRLSGPSLVTSSAVTRYTCPALTKTIIRNIHVQNPSASPVTFTLSIGADAAATRVFDAYTIAAGAILNHFCYLIVDAAEIVQALAGTTNIVTLTIDGDELGLG